MYKNAGKSIKNIVGFLVGVQIALFVILGIAFIVIIPKLAFVGVLIAAVGCVFAWASGLILYAYGEIADGVKTIAGNLKAPVRGNDAVDNTEKAIKNATGDWVCSGCGTENPAVRKYCLGCNASREWSDARK